MIRRPIGVVLAILILYAAIPCAALEPSPDALFVRVIDVGAGLSCVAVLPDGEIIIYDTGRGARTIDDIEPLIGGSEVDLLVISHTDSDHIGAIKKICDDYIVKRIVHPGGRWKDKTGTKYVKEWDEATKKIARERTHGGADVLNLYSNDLPVGTTEQVGEGEVTWVFGLSRPSAAWTDEYDLDYSERKNAGSIVMRLSFHGKSILFTGDSVGRHIGDPPDQCIAAEKAMVDNDQAVPLKSDVLIAPHHGADNGSTSKFIQKVDPEYVIFSAGSMYEHPRQVVADRFTSHGVDEDKMFRTDWGDNEGGDEWDAGAQGSDDDPRGDDCVDILISRDGDIQVEYRDPDHQ